MGDLEIRGLPDEVLRAVQHRAAANNRDVEAEVAAILIAAVAPHLRLGSLLGAIGAEIELTSAELAEFERDRTPTGSTQTRSPAPREGF
ncbi:plasmid stabilization protein [Nocardia cyriacigeorgica]|uniref:FitA-like ribbon-helix-helix domain-containing protein n=1 Tax=Nocardia cyriacigeorgica TaxID=135487 RepID=UPI001895FEE5|nr:plasmid stabilization protein [Nocardia cyriacigeorgica]MBF6320371.1 plasmid stabilization protein [Nocardia cyriacigeorgica]MBF6534143.1 plasmid stabilization protein [Nocardia cyriacigeorgica]